MIEARGDGAIDLFALQREGLGIFGQLSQLVKWDPTPMAVAATRAPKVINWVARVDDLSWWPVDDDSGWTALDELPSATTGFMRKVSTKMRPKPFSAMYSPKRKGLR